MAAVKYRIFLIVTAILLCLCFALPVRAADKVRVGCVDIGDFIQIDQDGYAIGYGADYLNKIAEYTGWEYEYIQAPWGECLDMLRRGELDLLLPAEYSEERAEDFLFSSYECCFDFAALVGRKSDERLYYDDYHGFQGIRVGMIKDNFLNHLFDEYAKNHGFSYEAVYYDTGTQILEALEREDVDAIINGNMEYNMNHKLLAKIDYMPAYFITSVDKPGLMVRLNKALKQIFIDNPYYSAGLYEKYYHEMDRQFAEFTREESQFVKQSRPVSVLVARSDYPFEWYDEKEKTCKGAYVDYMRHLSKVSGLNFEFIPLDPGEAFSDELFQENAQIRLSIFKQKRGGMSGSLKYTIPYYNCSFSLVGKKDEPLNLSSHQRIAMVEKVDGLQDVLEDKYPKWEIATYDTPKDCLTAVENGTADCAMVSSIKLSADRNLLGMNLVVVDGSTAVVPVYIGVSDNANPLLAQVLSKSIAKAGEGAMDEAVYATLLSGKENKDFSYFIQTYPLYFAFGVIAVSLLGVGILFMRYDARHQKLQNLILQKKNEELKAAIAMQTLLRRKAQTDSLTGLKNKSTTEELCRTCLEHAQGDICALFILDLDNFKHINDERGHQAGDVVLRAFGDTIHKCVRQDDVAGRIGGDEFMLFMGGIKDADHLTRFADRVYKALKDNPDFNATCSMGIAVARAGSISYEEMFGMADHALYKAKENGKNKYHIEYIQGETVGGRDSEAAGNSESAGASEAVAPSRNI